MGAAARDASARRSRSETVPRATGREGVRAGGCVDAFDVGRCRRPGASMRAPCGGGAGRSDERTSERGGGGRRGDCAEGRRAAEAGPAGGMRAGDEMMR